MKLSAEELHQLCQEARNAAIEAGSYIESEVGKDHDINNKKGGNTLASQVVTAVDLNAQKIILNHLQNSINKYDFGLLAEEKEADRSRLKKSYFWCVDPLDGTLSFTQQQTGYAVSIALISKSGDPLIGVVYIPDLQQCYSAIKGSGVKLNNKTFTRNNISEDNELHINMDRSLKSHPNFHGFNNNLTRWNDGKREIKFHEGYGAVRNAIAVMNAAVGCYFKFTKEQQGGGSIWDFAATRLLFEELSLPVTDTFGHKLHLNNPDTTFMNRVGVIYATHHELAQFIQSIDPDKLMKK